MPTDEPGTARHDRLPSEGGSRLLRNYTFAGGCVSYEFRLSGLTPSVVDEAAVAVGFVSRSAIQTRYDEAG